MSTVEVMLFLFMTECLGNWQPLVGIWKSKHHKEVYLAQKKTHGNFLRLKYQCYCGKDVVFLVNEQAGRLKMVADSLMLFPLRGRPHSLLWAHSGFVTALTNRSANGPSSVLWLILKNIRSKNK